MWCAATRCNGLRPRQPDPAGSTYKSSESVQINGASSADWVELAQKVESTLDSDIKLVRIVIDNAAALKAIVPRDERSVMKEMLQRRVESTNGLAEALTEIRGLLIDRIKEIDAEPPDR